MVSSSRCVVDRMPPSTTVCPSFTSTWVVISRVSIEGTFTPPEVTTTVPTASSLTSRSRMMRLSGVICGLTLSDSTAFLNWMVVAPLEADCWYGISTPCSMVASFWFAVITRGEEMMFAWVSAWAADSSRSTMKLLPRMPRAIEPAGLVTGRLTL